MIHLIQQGDVLIESCESMPGGKIVEPTERGFVLAEGEATGHFHAIADVEGMECEEKDGMFFIKLDREKTVTHEEHNPVTVPPGIYRVRKVREYDHFAEEARNVAD
jgi:hypothetical protein